MQSAQAGMSAMGAPNPSYSPSLMSQIRGGLTNMVGGPDNMNAINSGMSRLGKAQKAYQAAQGLLGGGQPQGGGGAPAPRPNFGQGASPTNFAQMTTQPNFMMQGQQRPQLPPQLAMLPPNDPRVLAYLQQMGGMYG
jgi:hypothetical protein